MSSTGFDKLQIAFLGVLEDLVRFRGTEPMIARIYSMIVLSSEPLTQEEISEKTGYSRSQISRYLSNLEQRGLIRKESKPGSRTQLYGGRAKTFFDEFKRAMEISEKFVAEKLDVIQSILDEWNNLSIGEKKADEAKRLHEVVLVFEAWFATYLELISDFNMRFRKKMNELEREIFPL